MEPIRLATQEEISKIAQDADLTPQCSVMAMDSPQGVSLTVVRQATEIDPMFFAPELPGQRKAMFVWGLENILRALGKTEYYFNVLETDKRWREVIETWGALPTSKAPEIRYKKVL